MLNPQLGRRGLLVFNHPPGHSKLFNPFHSCQPTGMEQIKMPSLVPPRAGAVEQSELFASFLLQHKGRQRLEGARLADKAPPGTIVSLIRGFPHSSSTGDCQK